MKSFARALVLALALAVGHAGNTGVSMSLKQAKMGSGVSIDAMSADFNVESKVSDDLTVGCDLAQGDSPLKRVFAKINQKMGDGSVNADVSMAMADNAITGDVTYSEGGNNIVAHVNSGVDNFVETVKYSRSGAGWTFKPTFNMQAKNIDLAASADYSADTNVDVAVNAAGEGSLTVNHKLSADTSVSVSGSNLDVNALTATVNHKLDADTSLQLSGVNMKMDALKAEVARQLDANTKGTVRFDVASKKGTLEVNRNIDAGRTLNVHLDPDNSMKVEVKGASDEDWSASINSPWGDFTNADLSVGRKFNF